MTKNKKLTPGEAALQVEPEADEREHCERVADDWHVSGGVLSELPTWFRKERAAADRAGYERGRAEATSKMKERWAWLTQDRDAMHERWLKERDELAALKREHEAQGAELARLREAAEDHVKMCDRYCRHDMTIDEYDLGKTSERLRKVLSEGGGKCWCLNW